MDDQKREESTPVVYRHKIIWEVTVGKKVFLLDDEQLNVLKEMSLAGKSSIVWFDGFAISIPHISCMEKTADRYQKGFLSEFQRNGSFDIISKEEFELNSNPKNTIKYKINTQNKVIGENERMLLSIT